MLNSQQRKNLFCLVKDLGKEAERIKNKNLEVILKDDNSPVSLADNLINNELIKFAKSTDYKNIISEESKNLEFKIRKKWNFFWQIDPIDGTKEYIQKGQDYTINIALCSQDRPVFSVVYAPSREEFYYAELGHGAFKNEKKIHSIGKIPNKIKIVSSKSHQNKKTLDFIELLKVSYDVECLEYGSSLKLCKVAEGKVLLYPRFSPTMEWDTCAAHLILNEAGGAVVNENNIDLAYNKKNLYNPPFIAIAQKSFFDSLSLGL